MSCLRGEGAANPKRVGSVCADATTVAMFLKNLQGEFTPFEFTDGSTPRHNHIPEGYRTSSTCRATRSHKGGSSGLWEKRTAGPESRVAQAGVRVPLSRGCKTTTPAQAFSFAAAAAAAVAAVAAAYIQPWN